ncbi:type II toxin-antitoxin system antitoxin DNA ADP-ribosyl glycohydrolase DarG [Algoriphagus terrigena]|uniref:type II toxin-antitoxin system antitoxin DNA ADP-ribosyl glycohydrolase DarG n=1 Tax=Algoriphagus terrigena TaxID=344884 RepID=UPI0003F5BDF3|nr:macro domain-containing protein [Algoriphagus terrigena]
MIHYKKGNLLDSGADALVNTVNTVGVMGKGSALQFKNTFPENYKRYKAACQSKSLDVGQLLIVEEKTLLGEKTIINFPTKKHWKSPSKYDYVSSGLVALRETLPKLRVSSVAIPPLGCGNGGLDWGIVKPMIENALDGLDMDIFVFEPNEEIKELLKKEESTKTARLTPARAMLLYLMFQYESVGDQSCLFVANKLAYFLQRTGENLRLNFEAHHYGPYTVQLNHVLMYLNGVYLNGMEQNTQGPFDPLELNYEKWGEIKDYVDTRLSIEQKARLSSVTRVIKTYESTYALELLASVDFVLNSGPVTDSDDLVSKLKSWNRRKNELFAREDIEIAQKHLREYSDAVFQLV